MQSPAAGSTTVAGAVSPDTACTSTSTPSAALDHLLRYVTHQRQNRCAVLRQWLAVVPPKPTKKAKRVAEADVASTEATPTKASAAAATTSSTKPTTATTDTNPGDAVPASVVGDATDEASTGVATYERELTAFHTMLTKMSEPSIVSDLQARGRLLALVRSAWNRILASAMTAWWLLETRLSAAAFTRQHTEPALALVAALDAMVALDADLVQALHATPCDDGDSDATAAGDEAVVATTPAVHALRWLQDPQPSDAGLGAPAVDDSALGLDRHCCGNDEWEALMWRIGSLRFMLLSSITGQGSLRERPAGTEPMVVAPQQAATWLHQCMGALYRMEAVWGVTAHPSGTQAMIALLYRGECCVWMLEGVLGDGTASQDQPDSVASDIADGTTGAVAAVDSTHATTPACAAPWPSATYHSLGKRVLRKFIHTVRSNETMVDAGWKVELPEDMLQRLHAAHFDQQEAASQTQPASSSRRKKKKKGGKRKKP